MQTLFKYQQSPWVTRYCSYAYVVPPLHVRGLDTILYIYLTALVHWKAIKNQFIQLTSQHQPDTWYIHNQCLWMTVRMNTDWCTWQQHDWTRPQLAKKIENLSPTETHFLCIQNTSVWTLQVSPSRQTLTVLQRIRYLLSHDTLHMVVHQPWSMTLSCASMHI